MWLICACSVRFRAFRGARGPFPCLSWCVFLLVFSECACAGGGGGRGRFSSLVLAALPSHERRKASRHPASQAPEGSQPSLERPGENATPSVLLRRDDFSNESHLAINAWNTARAAFTGANFDFKFCDIQSRCTYGTNRISASPRPVPPRFECGPFVCPSAGAMLSRSDSLMISISKVHPSSPGPPNSSL